MTSTARDSGPERPELGGPSRSPQGNDVSEHELPVPIVATDDEVLRAKRFDELAPDELAALYELMARLTALVDSIAGPGRPPLRSLVNVHELCEHVFHLLRGEARASVQAAQAIVTARHAPVVVVGATRAGVMSVVHEAHAENFGAMTADHPLHPNPA